MLDFINKNKNSLLVFIFILAWIIFLSFFSPKEIISMIGVKTSYLIIFLTALIGVSGFTSAPLYLSLFTIISSGEINIFILILIVSPAMTLADSMFFLLGRKGRDLGDNFLSNKLFKFSQWMKKKPKYLIAIFSYLYTSFTPLPQDILMLTLGILKVRFLSVILAVLLGNATFLFILYLFINFF